MCPRKFWLDPWAGQREGKLFASSLLGGNKPQERKRKGLYEVHPELSVAPGTPWSFIYAPGDSS